MAIKRPKIGIYCIGTPRFDAIGDSEATVNGINAEFVAQLKERLGRFCDVVDPGIIKARDQIGKAVDLFFAEHVDAVFLTQLTWTEDFQINGLLRDMPPCPIFFAQINKPINFTKTYTSEADFARFLSRGNLVGSLQGSGDAKRYGRDAFHNCVGTFDQVMEEFEKFAKVCSLRSMLRRSSWGQLGGNFEVMWSTYVDPYLFYQKFGPELHFLTVAELEAEVEKVDAAALDANVQELLRRYKLGNNFDHDKFVASVRASMAMEAMIKKYGISALSLCDGNPQLFEHIGLRPGFWPTPFGGCKDVPVVAESDLGACMATYVMKMISGGHVTMVEPFNIDPENDTVSAGHGGPNDYTDPEANTLLGEDTRFAKTPYKYAGAPFAWYVVPGGPKTFAHISQCGNGFKLVAFEGEGIAEEHMLASYNQARFRVKGGTASQLVKFLMDEGVTQHYALAPGSHLDELRMFAEVMGFRYCEFR